ncbi:MAG: T9SS type A sorting domain-containing protein [Psychroserpens sp.]|uniref:T9SS type A sorting domain-containing protein n=1 Tax=Psychroserpens sp. TaxID=2020870 RepID=UPI00300114F3
MMKNYFIIAFTLSFGLSFAQTTYNGNGNSGFGGVIGPSSMTIDDDGSTITFEITRGPGEFFDTLVIYLDTATGGRTSIDGDVNDQGDQLRRAISSAGYDDSVLGFPAGFEPDFALGIETGFGGVWSIPASGVVGDNGLPFVASLNSTLMLSNDATFTLEVDWSELGLTSADSFRFIGIYLNASNGFTSDEAYGSPVPGGNIGGSDFTFTSSFEYGITLDVMEFDSTKNIKVINDKLLVNDYQGKLNINVIDITGKIIKAISTTSLSNSFSTDLNLSGSQLYFITVEGYNFTKTLKVLSKK